METAKRKFIEGLIETAQESIWKNELTKDYVEKFSEGKDKIAKIKSCEHAIKKDMEYISFLREKLPISDVTGTIPQYFE